jgi:hypothetical protein
MPNIRRGAAFAASGDVVAAYTALGCITSRSGSDIATPAPCRNRRRETG